MIPARAANLIISYETNALSPYVPKNSSVSGVTLGIGYDMAHHGKHEIARDWLSHLMASDVELLQACTSLLGAAADAYRRDNLAHIRIKPEMGQEVFERASLPKYEALTQRAFPNWDKLHPLCYGALVSLVFNRGTGMGAPNRPSWDARREMREIAEALRTEQFEVVPGLLRSMKRLWVSKGLGGLLARREAEAAMFEDGLKEMT